MSYRFHAAAPPGEWINDPNALFFADGRSCLLVLADAAHVEQVLALVRAKARRALTEAERMADAVLVLRNGGAPA